MPKETFPEQARRAMDKLVSQFFDHPEVDLIDIGYDLENPVAPGRIALRVHTVPTEHSTLQLPPEIDGVPVIKINADYKPRG